MDILLKNMEMPVDHGIFIVICPSGTIEQKVGNADNGYPIYNIVKDAKAVALPSHGDLVEISNVKEALCIHGQASPWDSYVPVIVEATE